MAGSQARLSEQVQGSANSWQQVLAQVAGAHTSAAVRLPSYESAAKALFELDEDDMRDIPFSPSDDDSAYETLAASAPDVAAAIDDAAASVRTTLWSRRVIRNSLAWLVAGVVITLFVGVGALPPPWQGIASALLGASGLNAPAAYKKIAAPSQESPDAKDR